MARSESTPTILGRALLLIAALGGCANGGGSADASTDTDSETTSATETGQVVPIDDWLAMPCAVEGDECVELSGGFEGVFCRDVGDGLGFCTIECAPATHDSPGADACGQTGVCSDFSWLVDDGGPTAFCAQACVPTGASNPCRADYLACDPSAWAPEKATATCLLRACEDDTDCPVPVGAQCAGDEDCDVAFGETCDEDGALGCVFFGRCSGKTGRCTHEGKDGALVGDPCASTYDCGDNMLCRTPTTEFASGPKIINANGYCAKTGCAVVTPNNHGVGNQTMEIAVVDVYSCGLLGVCHQAYAGGMCFRRCDPTAGPGEVLGCRQAAWAGCGSDMAGDYECMDQTAFIQPAYAIGDPGVVGAPATATAPHCGWVGGDQRCEDGMAAPPNDSLTCEELFGRKDQGAASWEVGMECRDPVTGALSDQGYCLDESTSHWSGTWSDAPFDAGVDGGAGGGDAAVDGG